MGAGAVLFWPSPVPPFDPEKALAFGTALAIWVFTEFYSEFKDSKPQCKEDIDLDLRDSSLSKRILEIITDDFVRFLRDHDLGGSFSDRNTTPLYRLVDFFKELSSRFNDTQLEQLRQDTENKADGLARALAYGASPIDANARRFSMIPTSEPDGLWSQATTEKVEAANSLATELFESIEQLFTGLRRKGIVLGPERGQTTIES